MDLFEELKENLPLFAYPTKQLCDSYREKGIKFDHRKLLKITDVHDSGNISGIMCAILTKDTVVIVAITHLEFRRNDPLSAKIKKYQQDRELMLNFWSR